MPLRMQSSHGCGKAKKLILDKVNCIVGINAEAAMIVISISIAFSTVSLSLLELVWNVTGTFA
jgi:hypothetical protein